MTTIYIVRHAQSHPAKNVSQPEWPLSEAGKQQAERIVGALQELEVSTIYSSPFLRCRETIRPFSEAADIPVHIENDLYERKICDGFVDNFFEIWKKSWEDFDFSLPNCESNRVAQSRFFAAMEAVAKREPGKKLIVRAHGTVIGLFFNRLEPTFGKAETESIRNPDLFKVDFDGERFVRDTDFIVPESFAGVRTDVSETPGWGLKKS